MECSPPWAPVGPLVSEAVECMFVQCIFVEDRALLALGSELASIASVSPAQEHRMT